MTEFDDLMEQIPDAPVVGVTRGHTTHSAVYKEIFQELHDEVEAVHQVPAGGTTGQVFTKATPDDYDADWEDLPDAVDPAAFPIAIGLAMSDETTAITAGTNKVVIRAPYAFTLVAVRSSLSTASSSGLPTVDINKNGTTVLSTKLTIDASEKTSVTAATPAVISVPAFALDDEIGFDIDVAGTGAKGLKVWLLGTRAL